MRNAGGATEHNGSNGTRLPRSSRDGLLASLSSNPDALRQSADKALSVDKALRVLATRTVLFPATRPLPATRLSLGRGRPRLGSGARGSLLFPRASRGCAGKENGQLKPREMQKDEVSR